MPATMKDLGLDRLTKDERIALAQELWDSIPDESALPALSDAQKADLQLRLDRYRDDPTAGSPWEEVQARLLGRQ